MHNKERDLRTEMVTIKSTKTRPKTAASRKHYIPSSAALVAVTGVRVVGMVLPGVVVVVGGVESGCTAVFVLGTTAGDPAVSVMLTFDSTKTVKKDPTCAIVCK